MARPEPRSQQSDAQARSGFADQSGRADQSGDAQQSVREERPALPAAREWLVDGFNVLHHSFFSETQREQWWTEPHRRRLVERLADFAPVQTRGDARATAASRAQADLVWVVFDGPRRASPALDSHVTATGARVRVEFAVSADDWILKRVRDAADAARLAVVSVDGRLTARAKHRGAWVVTPGDFLAHCGR